MKKVYSCAIHYLTDEYALEFMPASFEVMVRQNSMCVLIPLDIFRQLLEMCNVVLPVIENENKEEEELPF